MASSETLVDVLVEETEQDCAVETPRLQGFADLARLGDAAQEQVVAALAQFALDLAEDLHVVRADHQAVLVGGRYQQADHPRGLGREATGGGAGHVAARGDDPLDPLDGVGGDPGALAVHDVRHRHHADAGLVRDVLQRDPHARSSLSSRGGRRRPTAPRSA
jgi:hypothetical protein